VRRDILLFWGSAVATALLCAAAAALFLPYDALQLATRPERLRAWLLTLWAVGVMAILFGLSGLLAFSSPIGFRDVAEAESVTGALETRRQLRASQPGFHRNFAWWLICTGLLLIVIYFIAWTAGVQ
jgi:hypothetical protein